MPVRQIRWSSLLNLTELQFLPGPPEVLLVSDELTQSIAWLTGATRHDRRLLRCDDHGFLITAEGWSIYEPLASDELTIVGGAADSWTDITANQGLRVVAPAIMISAVFVHESGGAGHTFYLPANGTLWYPHSCYSITVDDIPHSGANNVTVPVTAFG